MRGILTSQVRSQMDARCFKGEGIPLEKPNRQWTSELLAGNFGLFRSCSPEELEQLRYRTASVFSVRQYSVAQSILSLDLKRLVR